MPRPVLFAHELSFQYPGSESKIVHELSIGLYPGQITCLMGRSGTGKSSILKLLGGYLQAASGEIEIEGERLLGPKEKLVAGHPSIALAFQQNGLMHNRSVRDNIAFPIRHWEKHYIEERIDTLLQLCRLEQQAHQVPANLSGGQGQRLMLAMALAPEPPVLLLDEPFSQVDFPERQHLREAIRASKSEGTAVLLVSHEPLDALVLGDELLILDAEGIAQQASPQTIYHHPANPYCAGVLGLVNLLTKETASAFGIETKKAEQAMLRPEYLEVFKNTSRDLPKAIVLDLEFRGDHSLADLELFGQVLKARVAPGELEIGQDVFLEAKQHHVFHG